MRNMKMRASLIFALATSATAQLLQYGQNALPDCARQCTTLNNAAQNCYPSSPQPVLCLCQSSLLTQLKSTPSGTCDSVCPSASDQQRIFSWYGQFCSTGGISSAMASLAGATATAAQPTQTQGSTQATGTTDASDGSSSTTTTGAATTQNRHPSWWSTHARWIAMVIVLVIGFAIIIVIGIFLKKRYIKRRDQTLLNGAPTGWAPPANQHTAGGLGRSGEKTPAQAGGYYSSKTQKGKNALQKMVGR